MVRARPEGDRGRDEEGAAVEVRRCGKLIALTEQGREVIDATITRHVANEQRILASLTRAEQEKLNALLKKLIAGL